MAGTLWDGADLLAVLAGVGATPAAAGVLAGAPNQLVPASCTGEDVVAATADERVRSAAAQQQVREGAADQPVAPRSPGERPRDAVDEAADHYRQTRIGVESVAAPGEVADDGPDVARRAAHFGGARLARLGVVGGAIWWAPVRVPETLWRGQDEPPSRADVRADAVVDVPLIVDREQIDPRCRARAGPVHAPDLGR